MSHKSGPHKTQYRILVVDDEKAVRDLMSSTLTQNGYHVLTANGAASAIGTLGQQRVDMIISDVRMPNGSAHDLLTWVNRSLSVERPKVILMSKQSEVIEYMACQLGVDVFLVKPLDMAEFLQAVIETLPQPLARAN